MSTCTICGDSIDSGKMLTGENGPKHLDCWVSWMIDQEDGAHGGCKFGDCRDDDTHFVVFNPLAGERRVEKYCEDHAELAAEEARDDPHGDLFMGPRPLEELR